MMESLALSRGEDDQQMELPPGFRFHPTDEELITHYLSPKVLDSRFIARAIGDVDLNKCEPWDLPWRAKMGEKEWYFFCVRDRKYPTGLRTNRATVAGYWKATGKDKEIQRGRALVGMKKTLVFYRGRAPRGEKSNWVMHEYRLEGKFSYNAPSKPRNEWVICRVFQKSAGGKKTHISGLVMPRPIEEESDEIRGSFPPPLMEISSQRMETDDETGGATATSFRALIPDRTVLVPEGFGSPDWSLLREQSIMRMLEEKNNGGGEEYSQETTTTHDMGQPLLDEHDGGGAGGCDGATNSGGPVDLYCLWNY